MKDLEIAIDESKLNKAAGEDEIPYEMIKKLGKKAKDMLLVLLILNKSWSGLGVPRMWKTANIKPLLKDGKDPKSTSSYRPISLTVRLGKIYEKIIANRLQFIMESRDLLNQNQAGFRQGRSTADQILTQSAVDKFHGKKGETTTIASFFDYEKAFDKVWGTGYYTRW